jgi:hypothetical protein
MARLGNHPAGKTTIILMIRVIKKITNMIRELLLMDYIVVNKPGHVQCSIDETRKPAEETIGQERAQKGASGCNLSAKI